MIQTQLKTKCKLAKVYNVKIFKPNQYTKCSLMLFIIIIVKSNRHQKYAFANITNFVFGHIRSDDIQLQFLAAQNCGISGVPLDGSD